jgi:hypothetical protein
MGRAAGGIKPYCWGAAKGRKGSKGKKPQVSFPWGCGEGKNLIKADKTRVFQSGKFQIYLARYTRNQIVSTA